MFDSAARLLKNVARAAPLMIVFDYLQEADQASLLMLRFVARDEPLDRRDLVQRPPARATRLERSGGRAVRRRARHHEYQRRASACDHGRNRLNPLFVDGGVRMLLAEHIDLNAGLLQVNGFKVPDGVRETIRRRLRFLTNETNAMLSIAAVAGQEFRFECLRKASGSVPGMFNSP